MSEYINREDALNLDFRINVNMFESRLKTAERAVQAYADAIDKIPAADVRPVVLCKDCKHRPAKKDGRIRAPEDANGYTDYNCPFVCDDSWYNRMPADDDYCSCGEKREES